MRLHRLCVCGILLVQLSTFGGCDTIKARFARQTLPDLGPPLPLTARIEVDPSLSEAKTQYLDGCGRFRPLAIGSTAEDLLIQAAHQTFRTVVMQDGHATDAKPDVIVRLRLLEPRLKIQTDGLYDRAPAELGLDAFAEFFDQAGTPLAERPLQAARKERLQLELTQQRCDYVIDPLVQDTSAVLAAQFMQEARVLFDPAAKAGTASAAQTVASTAQATGSTAPPAGPAASSLTFKATLLDENGNQVLEGGERIRIRIDVVNAGSSAVPATAVQLAGPPALIGQFPATKLSVGPIEPGGSKSLEFVATLPQALSQQQAEFQVSLIPADGQAPPPAQALRAALQAAPLNGDDVDRIPPVSTGFQRRDGYLLAIGLGSYREPHIPARKYAGLDAETVAAYFQTLGGLPPNNVRLLRDWGALRPDIEEAIHDWLPSKVTKDSVVTIYFAGQAIVSPTGETFLIPYDGSLGSTTRLYPLKELDAALGQLKAKQILFIFDGTVIKSGAERAKPPMPKWGGAGNSVFRIIGTTGFGKSLESDDWRHGLLTYTLLRGLRGDADSNRNGEVTLGEATTYLLEKVSPTARSQFKQDQQPQALPAHQALGKNLDIVLTAPQRR
ncbi:MAG: hypothetical protein HRU82_15990 [Nitrospira sp.]|nr:MAG: hypothetical protein HRU82_15990 [Nitrospira sp.]